MKPYVGFQNTMITNPVVDDAIRFNQKSQNKLGISEEEQDKKKPKEPDYSKTMKN